MSRPAEHLTKWTALIVAFAFLMRVGEYAAELDEHGVCHFDPAKGLIWGDVQFRFNRRPQASAVGEEPDELVLHLRQTKNDPFRAGTSRNHCWGPEPDFCPVRLLWRLKQEGLAGTADAIF